MPDLVDRLASCAKEPSARLKVSETILDLAIKGLLNGLSNDKILMMVDVLKLCVSCDDARVYVAISISQLASNHLLGGLKNQPQKIVDLLDECSSENIFEYILDAIEVLLGKIT